METKDFHCKMNLFWWSFCSLKMQGQIKGETIFENIRQSLWISLSVCSDKNQFVFKMNKFFLPLFLVAQIITVFADNRQDNPSFCRYDQKTCPSGVDIPGIVQPPLCIPAQGNLMNYFMLGAIYKLQSPDSWHLIGLFSEFSCSAIYLETVS